MEKWTYMQFVILVVSKVAVGASTLMLVLQEKDACDKAISNLTVTLQMENELHEWIN